MASKWINAILWSLVSINLLILVLGGLVTWLGYAIPIRLRQFGLSPEITQLAGFASLLVACLGLGGLNYSSHYALNAYGFSCAIFIILMLLGALPDHWQRAIYNPSASPSDDVGYKQPQPQQTVQLLANTTNGINGTTITNTDQKRPKPDQPHGADLILDLLYIVLLLILSFLLTMAFIVAQYLRRRELEEAAHEAANNIDDEDELANCYSNLVADPAHSYSLRAGSVECNPMTALARQRQLIIAQPPAATNNRNSITDWNCTCREFFGGGGINTSHRDEQAATMTNQADVADNEFVTGRATTTRGAEKDEIRTARMQVSNIVASVCDGPHKVVAGCRELDRPVTSHNNELHDPTKRKSLQSVTPDQWVGRGQVNGGRHRHISRLSSRLADEADRSLLARRVSSKSLADLAINNNGCGGGDNGDDDSGDELVADTDDDISDAGCGRRNDRVASISGAVQAGEQPKISLVAPLVQKGIYYASGRGHEFEDCANPGCRLSGANDEVALLGGYHTMSGRSSSVQRRHQVLSDEHRHVWDFSHCYNQHYRRHQRQRTGPGREAGPSCCPFDTASSYMNTFGPGDLWLGLSHQI